ncbi:pilus assembly protein TadG-related protein [Palleronia sp. KMU-117]|uniref:TadE/TadG family type IV pilus assembly protein n=1 Tax=Palleronia sp. KMU-117 TaxID=3434108 RepID=UPI003D73EC2F
MIGQSYGSETLPLSTQARLFGSVALRRTRRFRQDEEGGIIILALFFFLGMVMVSGLAVDLMRFETSRVINQATMDRAALAAAGLSQPLDPRDVVIDYYVKAGRTPPPRETIDVQESYVGGVFDEDGNPIPGQEGELVSRQVAITSRVTSPNYFTNWVNVNGIFGDDFDAAGKGRAAEVTQFQSVAGSTALERIQNVEISLVVDISGSMGSNRRLINLKSAANEFIDTVVDEERTEGITSMSIIPYHSVVVTGPMIDYLNADGETIQVVNPPAHPGAITAYDTTHDFATCIRFDDEDFDTVVVDASTPLERLGHFHEGGDSYNQPSDDERWCDETRTPMLVHSTSVTQLKNHINSLTASGWTAVDLGIKWGAALLDPALRPVVAEMIEDNLIADRAENRPNDYDPTETMKVLVVMTDGENTVQRDLKQQFKNGPSRIWYSHEAWSTAQGCFSAWNPNQRPSDTSCRYRRYDSQLGRNLTWRDGFFVEMPNRSSSQRWYRPGHWNTTGDNRYYSANFLDSYPDARQIDYITLHDWFAEDDIANYFFDGADNTARNQHRAALEDFTGYSAADQRMKDICDAVKRDTSAVIFTLAFEAPSGAKEVMKYCATGGANGGFYYETDGTGISDAFRSIAGQITQLRLTQ